MHHYPLNISHPLLRTVFLTKRKKRFNKISRKAAQLHCAVCFGFFVGTPFQLRIVYVEMRMALRSGLLGQSGGVFSCYFSPYFPPLFLRVVIQQTANERRQIAFMRYFLLDLKFSNSNLLVYYNRYVLRTRLESEIMGI